MSCYHRPWTGNKVERRRAWNAINALGQHTRKDDVGSSIIAFRQHRQSDNVGRGMPSPPLDSTHSQTTSGVG